MKENKIQLTPVKPQDLAILQSRAYALARLDHLISALPLGMQAICLSEEAFDSLDRILKDPKQALSGPFLLTWHNACRAPSNITNHK